MNMLGGRGGDTSYKLGYFRSSQTHSDNIINHKRGDLIIETGIGPEEMSQLFRVYRVLLSAACYTFLAGFWLSLGLLPFQFPESWRRIQDF